MVSNNLDLGTQYHLNRFAMQFEATVLNEGKTLSPLDDPSMYSERSVCAPS